MTQPPYRQPHERPGYVPYDPAGGQQTPPGFTPAGPWQAGQPLAAANAASRKRFLAVMAFFAVLLVVSLAGFWITKSGEIKEKAATIRDGITSPVQPSPLPGRGTFGAEPPATGPVPEPVTYRGSGTKVLKIRRPEAGDALVYLKADPGRDGLLTVFGVDSAGRRTGFTLTSFGKAYEGVRLLDLTSLTRTTALEISTEGRWVVEIRSARSAPAFGGTASGRGDTVFRYDGAAGTATIRGGADMKPFVVMSYRDGFPRLVTTGIGVMNERKTWPAGPALVEVQATGRWTISVR